VLTGFLVPWVKTRMDRGSARRKTLLDAGLARQNEIITAQIRLLEQFSSLSWKYLFAAFKVSYSYASETEKAQRTASDEFAPLSWQLLMEIRATLSFAKRLASPQTQALLKETYDWMVWLDQKIWTMVTQQDTAGVWREFHDQQFTEAGDRVDCTIASLAQDLNLSALQDVSSHGGVARQEKVSGTVSP